MIPFSDALMNDIVSRMTRVIKPRKIVLFGSRARGNAEKNSDIDLLVIMDTSEPRHKRAIKLYGTLSDLLIPMDILVYTPEEVRDWQQVPAAFITTALREGKVIYEDTSGPDQKLAA